MKQRLVRSEQSRYWHIERPDGSRTYCGKTMDDGESRPGNGVGDNELCFVCNESWKIDAAKPFSCPICGTETEMRAARHIDHEDLCHRCALAIWQRRREVLNKDLVVRALRDLAAANGMDTAIKIKKREKL